MAQPKTAPKTDSAAPKGDGGKARVRAKKDGAAKPEKKAKAKGKGAKGGASVASDERIPKTAKHWFGLEAGPALLPSVIRAVPADGFGEAFGTAEFETKERLKDFARRFGLAMRGLYAERRHKADATVWGAQPVFHADSEKKRYCARFGLPARIFNSVRIALDGRLSSVVEKAKYDLDETQGKLDSLLRKREATATKIAKRQEAGKEPTKKQSASRDDTHSKIRKAEAKAAELNGVIAAQVPRVVFGGAKLWNAQYHQEANRFASHDDWLSLWRSRRDAQAMVVGSVDETTGNKTCIASRAADGSLSLSVLVLSDPAAMEQGVPSRLSLTGLRIPHREAELWAQIETNDKGFQELQALGKLQSVRKDAYAAAGASKDVLAELDAQHAAERDLVAKTCGMQPISYRFVFDDDGRLTVFIGIGREPAPVVTDRRNGVHAVDVNVGHLARSKVSAAGGFQGYSRLGLALKGKSLGQREALMHHVCARLVKDALAERCPLVVEDLDFAKKKRALSGFVGPKHARMLSSFPYARFREILARHCALHGVELIVVNPAYTSLQGAVLFARRLGLSIHGAAALAIGLRGLGCSPETPPVDVPFAVPDGNGGWMEIVAPARRTDSLEPAQTGSDGFAGDVGLDPTSQQSKGSLVKADWAEVHSAVKAGHAARRSDTPRSTGSLRRKARRQERIDSLGLSQGEAWIDGPRGTRGVPLPNRDGSGGRRSNPGVLDLVMSDDFGAAGPGEFL